MKQPTKQRHYWFLKGTVVGILEGSGWDTTALGDSLFLLFQGEMGNVWDMDKLLLYISSYRY